MFCANSTFCFFANFWVAKLKPFSEKGNQRLWSCFKKSILCGAFEKIVLKLPWGQKYFFERLKNFLLFSNFWLIILESFLREQIKALKLFNTKLCHGEYFGKVLEIFESRSWNPFLRKGIKVWKSPYVKCPLLVAF